MTEWVFDIEADGFLDEITKIHCLSYSSLCGKFKATLYSKEDIERFFYLTPNDYFVGHYVTGYDFKAIEKIYGIKKPKNYIDTLGLAWYLHPNRAEYGLESYGEDYGVPKPKVDDWKNLTQEEYTFRCEQDVQINLRLWKQLRGKIKEIYSQDDEGEELSKDQKRVISYINFKMDCLSKQDDLGLSIDKESILKHIATLESQKDPIISSLKESMPKVPQYRKKSKPKVTHKKDGTLSKNGEEWYRLLKQNKLPINYDGDLEILTGYEEPNPASTPQVKEWLMSMGWEPCTFKYVRDKDTGEERQVEQVRYSSASHPKKGELTESVLRLKDRNPAIAYLEGITVINHRLGVFEGFLKSEKTDRKYPYVVAGAGGFTNTLRFKHRVPVVNLPKVGKLWGEEIRGSLIAKEGKVFLGSDCVSLEATTKRHYMYPHDPEYVEEMSHPDFDEHLDLAVHAGRTTKEEALKHVRGEISLKSIRDPFKTVNYSAIYGVGVPKLAREGGFTRAEAAALLSAYWERNWSVKEVVKEQFVKTLKDGSMWLKNPVSGIFHSLRYEKDIFSTLNQSTGVYCFDTWVAYCQQMGVQIPMQYHDEILVECDEGTEEETTMKLHKAMEKTNEKVKLNVQLSVDVQVGRNYAEVH